MQKKRDLKQKKPRDKDSPIGKKLPGLGESRKSKKQKLTLTFGRSGRELNF